MRVRVRVRGRCQGRGRSAGAEKGAGERAGQEGAAGGTGPEAAQRTARAVGRRRAGPAKPAGRAGQRPSRIGPGSPEPMADDGFGDLVAAADVQGDGYADAVVGPKLREDEWRVTVASDSAACAAGTTTVDLEPPVPGAGEDGAVFTGSCAARTATAPPPR
ncbi:hypothetical protein GCM10023224_19310 [Streptomonospora halophila]|uniref:Uncharacterized protein n=2 Tax=Streptomonospora halophila TaxID=427369 RepID=A0ABP9GDP0_9ACTN